MKNLIVYTVAVLSFSLASCRKDEVCATYTKETKAVKKMDKENI